MEARELEKTDAGKRGKEAGSLLQCKSILQDVSVGVVGGGGTLDDGLLHECLIRRRRGGLNESGGAGGREGEGEGGRGLHGESEGRW